jgi:hypothetical protein
MRPIEITEIIGRKRYSTETATLLAGNDYWDGHNWERNGRNTFLYRTPKGNYFLLIMTCWQGERDRIEPLTLNDALRYWEGLSERRVSFEEAFPNVKVEDA